MFNLPNYIPDGFCLECRQCCRFLTENDDWRPCTFGPERCDPEINAACGTDKYIKTTPYNDVWACKLLTPENNHCTVYKKRPFECSLYPFILRSQDDKVYVAAHLGCPYLQQTFGTDAFNEYVERLKVFFADEAILNKIASDRDTAGDYAGYGPELTNLFVLPL